MGVVKRVDQKRNEQGRASEDGERTRKGGGGGGGGGGGEGCQFEKRKGEKGGGTEEEISINNG